MMERTPSKKPKLGDWVQVLYSVFGTDGSLIEERRDSQRPFVFRLGMGAVSPVLEEKIQVCYSPKMNIIHGLNLSCGKGAVHHYYRGVDCGSCEVMFF